ncbi:YciI family protein [Cellvibrio japonicus]|uniref:DGPF domain superfamily n=1 Tax=Cellvibrio japonicus (strain Ueda107) TaxID=498211 RepID=B3PD70_CELJU|nr:YciI family protein [Cellvibrio japonicus]ACE83095.1 DGPF domain superfamily [Cellvibrio japonicus Ueda107]QEI13336.1 YciI family protein [Cellvibrio japonicus]QEI16910.1 YciI family protein [Cellvibrio japonicus]QEI20488.1 YciI family protein [Cellvibrio japonicus]
MKYLCLVYYDEKIINAMTADEWQSLNRECVACVESLRNSGHMVGGNALHSITTATSLRVRDGKPMITDGPFAETKEQLAGFYLLDARDLNEALQLASKIPPARLGTIEVRPVRELDPEKDERFEQQFA